MNNQSSTSTGNETSLVISYLSIRKSIGILGMLLPPVLVVGNIIFGNCATIQESISHYYYTVLGNLFVGTLCAVALFLFCYKGYGNDNRIANLGGLFALGVAFFPTATDSIDSGCYVYNASSAHWQSIIHYTSASLFFITLAYFSYFLFTKTSGNMTPQKKKRNKLYKTCGIIIVGCIGGIALLMIPSIAIHLTPYKPTLIFETIALWAFGLSWLTKGDFILQDQ